MSDSGSSSVSPDTYEHSKGTTASAGFLYEMKIYVLSLLRGLKQLKGKDQFYLACNMKDGLKLDDVALKLDRSNGKSHVILLQSKYSGTTSNMTMGDLLNTHTIKGKIVSSTIETYFGNYLELVAKIGRRDSNTMFRGNGGKEVDYILVHYTTNEIGDKLSEYFKHVKPKEFATLEKTLDETVLSNTGGVYKFNEKGQNIVEKECKAVSAVDKANIKKFCERFRLCCGQASTERFDELIKAEISNLDGIEEDTVTEINSALHLALTKIWDHGKEGRFETRLRNVVFDVLFDKFLVLKNSNPHDLTFTEDAVKEFCGHLEDHKVVSIVASEAEANIYKPLVHQCGSRNNWNTIYIRPDMFRGIMVDIIKSKMPKDMTFLAVQCGDSKETENIIKNLSTELQGKNLKIIILGSNLSKVANSTAEMGANKIKFLGKFVYFKHFTEECKEILRQKEVQFQGSIVSLKDLFGSHEGSIDSPLLAGVLTDPNFAIGKKVDGLGATEPYYIPRTFEPAKQSKTDSVGQQTMNESDFISKILEGKDKKKSERVATSEKPGSEKSSEVLEGNDKIQSKMVVISGEPGSGKSTIVRRFSSQLKLGENETKYCSKYWIVPMTLNQCQFDKNKTFNSTSALEFLSREVLKDQNSSQFKMFCEETDKVILFLDGFDEIAPDYKKPCLSLIEALMETKIRRIVLTTRPHLISQLDEKKEKLNYHHVTLSRFTEDKVEKFLSSYFTESAKEQIKDWSVEEEQKRKNFILSLIKLLNKEVSEIIEIPLQTYMLAEIYRSEFLEYMKSSELAYLNSNILPDILPVKNITSLYNAFYVRKLDIYISEKRNIKIDNERKIWKYLVEEKILKIHMNYSKKYLKFGDDDIDFAPTSEEEKKLLTSFGIVYSDGNPNLEFIHRSFAEYFLALHVLTLMRLEAIDDSSMTFIGPVFSFSFRNELVRKFINGMDVRGSDEVKRRLRTFIQTNPLCISVRATLSISAKEDNAAIFSFLIQCFTPIKADIVDLEYILTQLSTSIIAAAAHSPDILDQIIKLGADVNERSFGRSALTYSKDCDVYDKLIENGARHTDTDYLGNTTLHWFARDGKYELVKHILDNFVKSSDTKEKEPGSSHSDTQPVGSSAPTDSRDSKRRKIDEETLEKPHTSTETVGPEYITDVDVRNKGGVTPLYSAVERGHTDIAKLLVNEGKANTNLIDNRRRTLVHFAAASRNIETIKWVVETLKFDIHAKDARGRNVLHCATDVGILRWDEHGEAVRYLIDQGVDANCEDDKGNTPLHYLSSSECHTDLFTYFMGHFKSSINHPNKEGETPLHIIAKSHESDKVLLLIENGADTTLKDNKRNTALHLACRTLWIKTVKCLVEEGNADVNATNLSENTPLHEAIEAGDSDSYWNKRRNDVIKLLVESEANLTVKNTNNKTPYDLALERNFDDQMIKLLRVP